MELKVNRINSFLGNLSNFEKDKTNNNSNENNEQITSISNVYYTHPTMETGISQKLRNILFNLYDNNCDPMILEEIQSLNEEEKEYFIKAFCHHTSFPNLEKVNNKMKLHAMRTMDKCAKEANCEIIYCGYHNHCSAAYNLALPGSDLDAMSAIITGNQKNVDDFCGAMWRNFDPTIVSIRKDFEFPDIYTIDQLYEWTQLLDEIIENSEMVEKVEKYSENLKETQDYEKALEFNIDIANEIKKYPQEMLEQKAPSMAQLLTYPGKTPKNVTQAMSSLLETFRSGRVLLQGDLNEDEKEKLRHIKKSYLYKYGNLCLQKADYGIKDKLIKRQEFINEENFERLSVDDKLDLILRMLYESYPSWSKNDIETHYGENFDELFDNGENVNESRDKAFRQAVD